MANQWQWLTIALLVSITFHMGGLANAQIGGDNPPKDDTTLILRQLARWDTDSTLDTKAQTFNDIWGWEGTKGREYAIMGGKAFTYFIDITKPRDPHLVAKKPGRGSRGIHRDYATYQHYCYAVTDEPPGALRIYDLQYLPDSVPLVYDSQEYAAYVHNVFREGKKLYLASNNKQQLDAPMTVLGLEDPEEPVLLNHLNPTAFKPSLSLDNVHDVYVRNDTVYASAETKGLFIFDYSDPRNPELISKLKQYPFQGYNHSAWLTADGQTMVMADETHGQPLKVYDVSAPMNLVFKNTMGVNSDRRSIPHNPIIKDDLAYVSYYHNGLQIFDISNPDKPERILQGETFPQYQKDTFRGYQGCWGVYPFFSSDVIAASDMTNGLYLYRIDTVVTEPSKNYNLTAKTRFRNKIKMRVDLYNQQAVELSLYNMQGQRLKFQETPVWPKGEQLITWNQLGGLEPGIYWLRSRSGNQTQVKKMLKAR